MQMSDLEFLTDKIQNGAICVMPTDTIYGLVATADQPDVVERIYNIKGRSYDKPFIILISELSQLHAFSIELNEQQIEALEKIWPGPVSIILPCREESLSYLHRGVNSLAFRMPDRLWLREIIHKTGPVIATSANRAGKPISSDINQIMQQLRDVDVYIEGPVNDAPSKLGKLHEDGSIEWIKRS